ncbi:carbohydrate ABC transporter permease [Caldinitratiruptor microaerophilus]|uniref:ABC transmembrane type-1 domain-containing protein n=1 Tax=Caldinitratiruptor microaerophilus TaxID=671077 RepID=A0AA35G9E2_9FIRM|nr:carbohydrate ABC transporter permease [Caldinitratiruptor microaerophilus]BDG60199.1 hypothetical protein caldi_12890 [Caldinitratiruptor microaerophilus]
MAGQRGRWLAYVSLAALVLVVGFPIYWMVVTSFKTRAQIGNLNAMFWPEPFVLDNYVNLVRNFPFLTWFKNSFIVALTSTLIATAVGTVGAYALARLRFLGRHFVAFSVLVAYLVPPTILFIPLYRVIKDLGLSNSLAGLIAAYPSFTVPLSTWLLVGFFRSIPAELEEAALIDGATRWQALTRVVLPLSKPGLVAAALFAFTNSWNEFLYALVFISDTRTHPLTVGLTNLILGDVYLWGELMAAAVLGTIPVVVLYIYLQKYVVAGLTAGAVKG